MSALVQCSLKAAVLANARYSRKEYLGVVGIPTSIPSDLSDANVSKVFDKVWVHAEGERHSGMSSFKSQWQGYCKIQQQKIQPSGFSCQEKPQAFGPTEFDLSEGLRIFMNKSVCAYYRGLCNKYKELKKYG